MTALRSIPRRFFPSMLPLVLAALTLPAPEGASTCGSSPGIKLYAIIDFRSGRVFFLNFRDPAPGGLKRYDLSRVAILFSSPLRSIGALLYLTVHSPRRSMLPIESS